MTDEDTDLRRVRFSGTHDLAAGRYVDRVVELVEHFDPSSVPPRLVDIIELRNVQQYLENDFLPRTYSEEKRCVATSRNPHLRSAVARFFSGIDDATCASVITDVNYEYHADLLELLGRNKAFVRCAAATMLPALKNTGVHLGEMLAQVVRVVGMFVPDGSIVLVPLTNPARERCTYFAYSCY